MVARFVVIDGLTQGGLVAVELFTTVIPLIVIGFSYLSGFAENVSPGIIFERELNLSRPLSDLFQAAFGTSSGLKSTWTVLGVAGFLIWGRWWVSMALMTWCGVIGVGWVATACVSAVLWERNAPATTVIEAQVDEVI